MPASRVLTVGEEDGANQPQGVVQLGLRVLLALVVSQVAGLVAPRRSAVVAGTVPDLDVRLAAGGAELRGVDAVAFSQTAGDSQDVGVSGGQLQLS